MSEEENKKQDTQDDSKFALFLAGASLLSWVGLKFLTKMSGISASLENQPIVQSGHALYPQSPPQNAFLYPTNDRESANKSEQQENERREDELWERRRRERQDEAHRRERHDQERRDQERRDQARRDESRWQARDDDRRWQERREQERRR